MRFFYVFRFSQTKRTSVCVSLAIFVLSPFCHSDKKKHDAQNNASGSQTGFLVSVSETRRLRTFGVNITLRTACESKFQNVFTSLLNKMTIR